ncbi:putative amino acid ABC transporter substrate-binding protein [Agrobacterium rubi TR3 = NBRC 13261]|uniref:Putative amino acid ABC transporter substrate-binding protein n=1 Tax=Agrobacterium rubi TR3 = NBRC 13261 TaxID=1368415 RepID=A0A081CZK6_9HYPH|nr:ABC transporter substrate-binding protein [Agrobacterium rubi]MBP1880420.1 polar amino acid transport system substrate-binding protein [Agrobacterium rubi]MCL6654575.1 amino acid ABC transporter [Agrobacterium rubi]GAK72102.1 putative amino acid ABC transporter substrate-binding protein [Agrobacterium rubi TR3 = NBRC 13261]
MAIRMFTSTMLAGLLSATMSFAQGAAIPAQKKDEALHARLPEKIRTAGKMTSVNNGSFPPYEIVTGTEMTGASADLTEALGQVLGVKIDHATVGGLPALLAGVNSGRYQFAFGPVGDFKSREESNDFVDWVQEFVVFAVQKGNPKGIVSLDTACGHRIAVMAGGSAERVIQAQNEKCKADGKALEVQSFSDQPSSILAVRSKRSDAFFSSQAPLTYFVSQANGQLELTGVGEKNGFDSLYQGAVVPKGSPLAEVLRDGIKVLMDNGTYAAIMKKWGLENNALKEPGINLGGMLPQ